MKDSETANKIYSFSKRGEVTIRDSKEGTQEKKITTEIKNLQPQNSAQYRQSINDSLITKDIFDKIVTKMYERVDDIYNIRQSELIDKLLPLGLSYKTIARVVNEMCDGASATDASIRNFVCVKRKKEKMLDALLKDLEL